MIAVWVFVCMCIEDRSKTNNFVFFMSAFKYYLPKFQKGIYNISPYYFLWNIFSSPGYVLYLFFISIYYIYLLFRSYFNLHWSSMVMGNSDTESKYPVLSLDSFTTELATLDHFTFFCAPFACSCEWRCYCDIHGYFVKFKRCRVCEIQSTKAGIVGTQETLPLLSLC